MRSFIFMIIMAVSLAVTGCGSSQPTSTASATPYMFTVNAHAADALHEMLLLSMGSGGNILTASFVDISDFEKTSAFGRVTSQQIGSRLGQRGLRVIEARLASTLAMDPRVGEFMLTREAAKLLSDSYDADAVLVGSYSPEGDNIFVSTRVVRLADNVIVAAYEYYLPHDSDVNRLLASSQGSGTSGDSVWERYSNRARAFPCGFKPEAPAYAKNSSSTMGAAPTVPRYVDPAAKAPAPAPKKRATQKPAATPVTKAATSAPASAPVSRPAPTTAPVVMDKDALPPPSTPGGV